MTHFKARSSGWGVGEGECSEREGDGGREGRGGEGWMRSWSESAYDQSCRGGEKRRSEVTGRTSKATQHVTPSAGDRAQ